MFCFLWGSFCVLILKLFISMFSEYLYHWKEIDSVDVNRWKSITFLKIIHLHVNLFDTVIAKKAAFKKPRETWMTDFHFIYQLKVKAYIHKVFFYTCNYSNIFWNDVGYLARLTLQNTRTNAVRCFCLLKSYWILCSDSDRKFLLNVHVPILHAVPISLTLKKEKLIS